MSEGLTQTHCLKHYQNISNTEVKTRIVISNKGVRYILLTDKKVEDMPSLEGTFDNVPKSASDIYKKS